MKIFHLLAGVSIVLRGIHLVHSRPSVDQVLRALVTLGLSVSRGDRACERNREIWRTASAGKTARGKLMDATVGRVQLFTRRTTRQTVDYHSNGTGDR